MQTPRRPGMDHQFYPYSPLPSRKPIHWPGGARIAFWVLLHIDCWELDPPKDAVCDSRLSSAVANFRPDYRTWTQREYGNRVGVFRVLDILDRHGIRPTVALGAEAARRYPYLVDALRERGAEFVGHGDFANRMISSQLAEAEERKVIAESIETVTRATGTRPRGWLGQDSGESFTTPTLVAEAGIDYLLDWANDDEPYEMTVGKGLVALPHQVEWDDAQLMLIRHVDAPRYPDLVGEAFAGLHEEAGKSFCLNLHPWLIGMPHRVRYLDEALRRIAAHDKVWQATAGEIVDAFRAGLQQEGLSN